MHRGLAYAFMGRLLRGEGTRFLYVNPSFLLDPHITFGIWQVINKTDVDLSAGHGHIDRRRCGDPRLV